MLYRAVAIDALLQLNYKLITFFKLFLKQNAVGKNNLIFHRNITSYNPASFDNTLLLFPRLNGYRFNP